VVVVVMMTMMMMLLLLTESMPAGNHDQHRAHVRRWYPGVRFRITRKRLAE